MGNILYNSLKLGKGEPAMKFPKKNSRPWRCPLELSPLKNLVIKEISPFEL
jgi:hypothetical protein